MEDETLALIAEIKLRYTITIILFCIVSFIIGMVFAKIEASGKTFFYMGPDQEKYNNTILGILTK